MVKLICRGKFSEKLCAKSLTLYARANVKHLQISIFLEISWPDKWKRKLLICSSDTDAAQMVILIIDGDIVDLLFVHLHVHENKKFCIQPQSTSMYSIFFFS